MPVCAKNEKNPLDIASANGSRASQSPSVFVTAAAYGIAAAWSTQLGPADPFAQVSRAEAAAVVADILDTIDEDQRIVFALVELEQLSVPKVAEMLEIKLNTAYSRLRLARASFELALRTRKR
jgi:DNA-directed RNA polymerase specialized sigma24 family protein